MPNRPTWAFADQLASLFEAGTCAGMTDGDLLEQFRSGRGEASERAFEALVERHGPMVLSICRGFLEDSGDVHDAFQAVFLVLARRAVAIRKGESVGSWLYGVGVRVAARARAAAIRRRIRERRALAAAEDVASGRKTDDGAAGPTVEAEHRESAAAVHEEVGRLPESYRAPILLCYFEGLTHDEAATRLSWPVGTVRSRLARARDRLRGRLERRGVTAPATIGAMAAWREFGHIVPPTSAAATLPPLPQILLPRSLTRAGARLAAGQTASAGVWPATSMALADGVLKTMLIKKLMIAGCFLASVGIGTGAGLTVLRKAQAQDSRAPVPAATRQSTGPARGQDPPRPSGDVAKAGQHLDLPGVPPDDLPGVPPETDPRLKPMIAAAQQRLEAQRAFYEEGRLTIDRFIAACSNLERVLLLAAKTDEQRRVVRQRHIDLLKEIERREQGEIEVGRGTTADVAEIVQARVEAEFNLKSGEDEEHEKAKLIRRISELERKVAELEQARQKRDGR